MGLQNDKNFSPNLMKLMDKKVKRLSKLMFEQKNEILVPKTLVLKQEENKINKKDSIGKFQNMNKLISTAGIKE